MAYELELEATINDAGVKQFVAQVVAGLQEISTKAEALGKSSSVEPHVTRLRTAAGVHTAGQDLQRQNNALLAEHTRLLGAHGDAIKRAYNDIGIGHSRLLVAGGGNYAGRRDERVAANEAEAERLRRVGNVDSINSALSDFGSAPVAMNSPEARAGRKRMVDEQRAQVRQAHLAERAKAKEAAKAQADHQSAVQSTPLGGPFSPTQLNQMQLEHNAWAVETGQPTTAQSVGAATNNKYSNALYNMAAVQSPQYLNAAVWQGTAVLGHNAVYNRTALQSPEYLMAATSALRSSQLRNSMVGGAAATINSGDPVYLAAAANEELAKSSQNAAVALVKVGQASEEDVRLLGEARRANHAMNLRVSQAAAGGAPATLFQRFQAGMRPGGDPYAQRTFGQFFGQHAANTLGYALPGLTIGVGLEELTKSVEEASQAQRVFAELQAQFQALGNGNQFQGFRTQIQGVSNATGLAVTEVAQLGMAMKGVYGSTQQAGIALQNVATAAVAMGLSTQEAQQDMTAITQSFSVFQQEGPAALRTVSNEMLHLQDLTGVDAKNILAGTADVSATANQIGMSPTVTASMVAAASQKSGLAPTVIAQTLSKLIDGVTNNFGIIYSAFAQDPAVSKRTLSSIGAGGASGLQAILANWDQLPMAERIQLQTSLGINASAVPSVNALVESGAKAAYLASTQAPANRTQNEFRMQMNTLSGAFQKLSQQMVNFGVNVIDGPVGHGLVQFANALGSIVDVLSHLSADTSGLSNVILAVGGAGLAFKVLTPAIERAASALGMLRDTSATSSGLGAGEAVGVGVGAGEAASVAGDTAAAAKLGGIGAGEGASRLMWSGSADAAAVGGEVAASHGNLYLLAAMLAAGAVHKLTTDQYAIGSKHMPKWESFLAPKSPDAHTLLGKAFSYVNIPGALMSLYNQANHTPIEQMLLGAQHSAELNSFLGLGPHHHHHVRGGAMANPNARFAIQNVHDQYVAQNAAAKATAVDWTGIQSAYQAGNVSLKALLAQARKNVQSMQVAFNNEPSNATYEALQSAKQQQVQYLDAMVTSETQFQQSILQQGNVGQSAQFLQQAAAGMMQLRSPQAEQSQSQTIISGIQQLVQNRANLAVTVDQQNAILGAGMRLTGKNPILTAINKARAAQGLSTFSSLNIGGQALGPSQRLAGSEQYIQSAQAQATAAARENPVAVAQAAAVAAQATAAATARVYGANNPVTLQAIATAQEDWLAVADASNQVKIAQAQLGQTVDQASNNTIGAAAMAVQVANAQIAAAHGAAATMQAEGARATAEQQYYDAITTVMQGRIGVLAALAGEQGNPVQQAYLQYHQALVAAARQASYDKAHGTNPQNDQQYLSDVQQAYQQQQNAMQTQVSTLETIGQTELFLGQITATQYISQLTAELSKVKGNKIETENILQQIRQVQNSADGNLDFNIPQLLVNPTLYQARRMDQFSGGYVDNRNVTVNVNVNGADPRRTVHAIQSAIGHTTGTHAMAGPTPTVSSH